MGRIILGWCYVPEKKSEIVSLRFGYVPEFYSCHITSTSSMTIKIVDDLVCTILFYLLSVHSKDCCCIKLSVNKLTWVLKE